MIFAVTPIYAALLTVLFLLLSVRVVMQRNAAKAIFGDGGDTVLMLRIRAHGNFAEYAPLGIVLLVIAELTGAPGWGLHLGGALLLAGRCLHALALSGVGGMGFRVAGMVMTFAALTLGAGLGVF